jgi:hypothetical protein
MQLGNLIRLSGVCLLTAVTLGAAESVTNRFGFMSPEIFPIDNLIESIRSADIDGDGLKDLVVVNNARSRINVLFNRTGKTGAKRKTESVKRELNELPPDARFEIDSIASEKRIAAIVVTDLNGDQRPDIAYYGEPKELVVLYNDEGKGWSAPKRWPIDDVQLTPNAIAAGDLNGDGRTDLVLLAEGHIHWLAQDEAKTLGEPRKLPYSGAVKSVQILDLNGDKLDDLLLVNWEHPNPFRIRFQTKSGQLAPELHFTYPQIRSYWADDLDGDHRAEMVTIAMNSGRAQVGNFSPKAGTALHDGLVQGAFEILPLSRTDKARRGIVWADLNGDERDDLLVAEPDSGQLSLFLQEKDGTLGTAKLFPTLAGVSEIVVGDCDGDKVPEIYLLSADERTVGVTSLDKKGRIEFPKILPFKGRPLAVAILPVKGQKNPVLAVITDEDGKRSLVLHRAGGEPTTRALAASFKSNPAAMNVVDVNQDGFNDLVVLVPYEKIKVLLMGKDGVTEEVDVAPPGGALDQPWSTATDVDEDGKDELLLGQKNFVRAVVLQRTAAADTNSWAFVVKEQINGAASNSRIVGATALAAAKGKGRHLFLLDAERKSLTLCARDSAGVWRVERNLQLPITEFTSLQSVTLGGGKAVSLVGRAAVAWQMFAGKVWELTELDGYETPIKDGYLHDVVSGDLNNDGRKDLVFLETRKNYLDVVMFEKPHKLVPANRWPVFEERTFRNRRSDMPEPREALVADFTGDGKNDLVILVHDRVLLYPQE